MTTIDIRRFKDVLVLYFDGEVAQVNAYTLATVLVGLSDAAKAANAEINPGEEIELVVEALNSGSFKATIRALYSSAGNLFSKKDLKTIILSLIATYIYQHALAPPTNVVVNVRDDEVVIVQGDTRIIVPRTVHEMTEHMGTNRKFERGVADMFRAIDSDPKIASIGLSPDPRDSHPPPQIPREQFAALLGDGENTEGDERYRDELADLRIVRAILERSRRKWEFVWNGMRISAPVTDHRFYDRFFSHRVTIAPGDILRARLRIRQRRARDLNVFLNDSYEVVEVVSHVPAMRQDDLPGGRQDPER